MPLNSYAVRICLSHFVSDCFLYTVEGSGTQDGDVTLQPLSYFSCSSTRLKGKNVHHAENIETHVPIRLKNAIPHAMLKLEDKASLFWLPTMSKIKANDIKLMIMKAYSYTQKQNVDVALLLQNDNDNAS